MGIEVSLKEVKNADVVTVLGWFFEAVRNAPEAKENAEEAMAELGKISVKSETIDGEEATIIMIHKDYEGDEEEVSLVKEDGRWRIDREEFAMLWTEFNNF